ncbi:MAG: alpha/beta fold hydrolase [candidate division Zixibacteria bacterium]|nr:alpha/beta fold hydrolase [candidate division Zixibacteria bacterium]
MQNLKSSFRSNFKLLIIILSVLGVLMLACTPQQSAVEEGRIEINGIEIYYKMMGSGDPIFVLSGGPGDALETMRPFEALADEYKLIFYDQRAACRSTGDADTASHDLDNFVDDLEQLRVKLAPEKINIIGGSWGCMVGMHYAFKYPENVNALILASTMGASYDYFPVYRANIDANRTTEDSLALEEIAASEEFARQEPETVEKFWRHYFRAYCFDPSYSDSINLWYRDTTYKRVEGRYRRLWQFLASYDIRDSLKLVTCPTMILYGDYDPTPIEWVQPIHEGIAGSKLVVFEDAGHWLWVEATDEVIRVIRGFLKE